MHVSRDLGVNEHSLHKQKKDYLSDQQNAFLWKGLLKPEQEELRKKVREIARLTMERDILKRALGYFAKVKE